MGIENRFCYYDRCWLPKDNSKYLWQVGLLAISFIFLLQNITKFSFISIFLFILPVIVDIMTTELKSKAWTVIRCIFGVANGIIVIFCFLGFGNVIIDKGNCFALVSTYMFFSGLTVKKIDIAKVLAVDILVPFIFLISAPSRKTLHSLKIVQTEMEEVKHR